MNIRTPVLALCVAIPAVSALAGGGGDPTVGPQVRIDVAGGIDAANETTAASSELLPLEVIAAWNDWRDSIPNVEIIRVGAALSLDGGATWVDFLVRPPVPNQASVEGDPMTAYDDRTGTLWVGGISFAGNGGLFVARKDPGSAVLEPPVMAHAAGGIDKGWMAAGPRLNAPGFTRVYIAYNLGIVRSSDMGDTWIGPFGLPAGLGYLPRVGADGFVYVAYWDWTGAGDQIRLARSIDSGTSFTDHLVAIRMDTWGTETANPRFPGTFRVPPLVTMDVDRTTGTLYVTYFDTTEVIGGLTNVDIYLTKSTDQGDTWTTPVVINGDGSPPGDQFFPWVEVDREGRVHVVFFDSRHTVQPDSAVHGMYDAYHASSDDGGRTWVETRLTRNAWDSDDDGLNRPSQFIGDYLGMAVAGRRVYPIYTDTSAGDPDTFTRVFVFPGSGDLDDDGAVGITDLLDLLAAWGPCSPDCATCPADLNGDCAVGIGDLLILLANWT